MKKITICTLLSASVLFTSCLGSFSAFNNLKDWNQNVSDSKFVNNLVFWAFNIIPVYGLFFLGDTILFNVIEFWSGSNPIAMNEGASETQIVEHDGNKYKMTATKNRLQIHIIEGERTGEKLDLVYSPTHQSWSAIKSTGEVIKLASMQQGLFVLHLPDGDNVKIDPSMNRSEGLAIIRTKIATATDIDSCLLAESNH